MDTQNLITLDELARRSGLAYPTLAQYAREGKLEGAFKFAGRWVVPANIEVERQRPRREEAHVDV